MTDYCRGQISWRHTQTSNSMESRRRSRRKTSAKKKRAHHRAGANGEQPEQRLICSATRLSPLLSLPSLARVLFIDRCYLTFSRRAFAIDGTKLVCESCLQTMLLCFFFVQKLKNSLPLFLAFFVVCANRA